MKKYIILASCYNGSSQSAFVYEGKFYNTLEECQKRCDDLNKNKPKSIWMSYSKFTVEELTEYKAKNS